MELLRANGYALAWMLPILIPILGFVLFGLAKGNHGKGYTLFGSERLGNVVFLYVISMTITTPFVLISFGIGLWKLLGPTIKGWLALLPA